MTTLLYQYSNTRTGSTKTYERISTNERSIVNTHSIDITAKFAVSIKEKQDRRTFMCFCIKSSIIIVINLIFMCSL